MNIEVSVQERYSAAAQQPEPGLCCPVSYDPSYLTVIPEEVLERDYGCGDPSSSVRPGETVLDLGCGGGKICFIAAQIVGSTGKVIGVDINDEMLALARRAQPLVAERLGYQNVTFRKGRIEDLTLDRERLNEYLHLQPVVTERDFTALEATMARLRTDQPLIEDASIDVVISNCVLNLVSSDKKRQMFAELYRVLVPGGRAVISDIVADQDVPLALQQNPELWSGCYTGALREDRFLWAFVEAGFHGITILKRDQDPWSLQEGIAFRSMTIVAYKPAGSYNDEQSYELLYRGPFQQVVDDAGNTWQRGKRTLISSQTYRFLKQEPYHPFFDLLPSTASQATSIQPVQSALPPSVVAPVVVNIRSSRTLSSTTTVCGPDCGCNNGETTMTETPQTKTVAIFEKNCCGPSPSTELAAFLQRKFGSSITLKIFDLGKPNGLLPIPPSLLLKIQSEGGNCLPAMVVDGVVVAERSLPNLLDAVELVQTGQPNATSIVSATGANTGNRCC
jgi:arsenite methyltransferase